MIDDAATDASGHRDRHLSPTAGQQVFVTVDSMTSPTAYLPDAAFENLLIASIRHPKTVEEAVRDRGLSPAKVGVVPLSGSSLAYEGPLWTARRVNPNDLTGLSIEISRGFDYLRPGEGWFCFDTVSTMLMYANERRLHRFLGVLAEQCRRHEVTGVYGFAPGTASGETLARFLGLFDARVDVTDGEVS